MKKTIILTICLALLCPWACAEIFDPVSYAQSALTEVYGYTESEAENFVFDDDGAGTLRYHDADHPDWSYLLTYNDNRWEEHITPFRTEYAAYPGESAVRDTLNMAKEKHWFTEWTPEHREALSAWMNSDLYAIHIRREFKNMLEMDDVETAQIINAFFACCYGDEYGWPVALTEWRDLVLAEYGLSLNVLDDKPMNGMKSYNIAQGLFMRPTQIYEFKGEVPAEYAAVFMSEENLNGWNCITGSVKTVEALTNSSHDSLGLAVFEKNERRILVLLDQVDGEWGLWTLGSKAIYQDPTMDVSVIADPEQGGGFIIRYDCTDGVRIFNVAINDPTDELRGHFALCSISGYRYVSADKRNETWINMRWNADQWTYTEKKENIKDSIVLPVQLPQWLGLYDIADFPDTVEKAQNMQKAIPDDCVFTTSVHFRKDHSSHSTDLGMLTDSTIIRVNERVPGDPDEWIKTRIGDREGYVTIRYTSAEPNTYCVGMLYPLPVAVTNDKNDLKTGTGLFAPSVCELPAGTRMHVVIDNGNWLYVVIPREPLDWKMDIDGTYGYIRKKDVKVVAADAYLDWE